MVVTAVPASQVKSIEIQPTIVQGTAVTVNRGSGLAPAARLPPQNRWADNICDWPKNLWPSCWCACCCMNGCYITSQIAEKVGCAKFNVLISMYIVIYIIAIIVQAVTGQNTVVWLPAICASIFAICVRMHIVKKDNITECGTDSCCNLFGECCCGFWCNCCSIAQMARHIYGYTKVLDGDGDPWRQDQYTQVGQQV